MDARRAVVVLASVMSPRPARSIPFPPRSSRRFTSAPRALALVCALAACSGTKPPDTSLPAPLKAGAAQRALQLPVGHSTAGYTQSAFLSSLNTPDDPGSAFSDIFPATRGMETAPQAKVLVLDNGLTRLVIAKIDAIFITAVLTERVLQLAREKLHLELAGKLILQATHTHAAGCRFSRESLSPQALIAQTPPAQHALAHGCDTFNQESLERVAGPLVEAIGAALASLSPAKLGHASESFTPAAHDRRCENDWITGGSERDTRLSVIRVETADGTPIAVLFHHAFHGTIYGGSNRMLSTDAPGHAELEVEKQFGTKVVAMYLQGAAGDVSPDGGGNSGTQAMRWLGAQLAPEVRTLWDKAAMVATLSLQSREREVPLSHALLGYAPKEFYEEGAVLCQALYAPACPGAPLPLSQVLCIGPALPGLGKTQTRVLAAKVGDLVLLTLPGEPVTAVARGLVEAVKADGAADALVLGYAQDHDGYILLDQDWLSGGYEPTISFWGWRFGAFITAQSADLFHQLKTGKALAELLPAPKPVDPAPLPYTPEPGTSSIAEPSVIADAPASLQRLDEVRFSFHGGDPALGTPAVHLQKQDNGVFADVVLNGWIPVDVERGEIPLTYAAVPTHKADPGAAARDHRWEAVYQPPVDLPAGSYRLHVTGQARLAGAVKPFDLASRSFSVAPATLLLEARLAIANGVLKADVQPLYPAKAPVYAPNPSGDWQTGNYRYSSGHYAAPFAPAQLPAAAVAAELKRPDGTTAAVQLQPVLAGAPGGGRYAPGEGPTLHLESAATIAGHYQLHLPAGAVVDPLGNPSAEATFGVDGN